MKRCLLVAVSVFLLAGRVHAKESWICVEAKDFVVVSNGPEDQARYLAVKLEAFRSVLMRIFHLRWIAARPLTIMAFKNWASFNEVKFGSGVLGQFMHEGAEDIVVMIMLDTHDFNAEQILLHEYTHALTATSIENWPPWLREGVAEVYSSFQVEGNKVILGVPVRTRLLHLRGNYLIPIEGLIKQHPKGHDIHGGAMFYPQSWALTHFLMFGEKRVYLDKLVEYAHRCETGTDSEKMFREVFQIDYKVLEKKLTEYIRREEFPGLTIEYGNMEFEKQLKVRPLSEAELQVCYGNVMLNIAEARGDQRSIYLEYRSFDGKRIADQHFRRALALDPQCGRAYEGYSYLDMLREDYKAARQHCLQALQLSPNNAQTHYLYGLALYEEVAGRYDYAHDVPPDTAKAIFDEATTALKLQPTAAECYDLLARLCLNPSENLDEGMRLIDSALRARPRNYMFQLTRSQLLYRKGDYPAARKMLTALIQDDEKVEYKIRMAAQRTLDKVARAEAKR